MRVIVLSCFFILLMFVSCKKKHFNEDPPPLSLPITRGLPQNLKTINGFFSTSCAFFSGRHFRNFAYAAFADPGRDLFKSMNHYYPLENAPGIFSGNIDLGDVFIDTCELVKHSNNSTFVSYSGKACAFLDSLKPPRWRTQGNQSFRALDVTLPTNYPIINYIQITEIYKSKGFEVDLSEGFRNFDSVVILLTKIPQNEILISKASSTRQIVKFSSDELSFISSNEVTIYFYAFNYYHQIINGKVYLFEQGTNTGSHLFVYP